MTRYMLDTNAFDYLLDRAVDPRAVRRLGDIYITTVQHGELLSVPDPRRRKRLLRVLAGIDPTVRPAVVGPRPDGRRPDGESARPGEPADREPADRCGKPSDVARRLYGAARKAARWKDAAIGEAAELGDCVLVTDDRQLRQRAAASGLVAMSCAEAFSSLVPSPPPSVP